MVVEFQKITPLPSLAFTTRIAFSSTGKFLACAERQPTQVSVWDTTTWELVYRVESMSEGIEAINFGADDNTLIVAETGINCIYIRFCNLSSNSTYLTLTDSVKRVYRLSQNKQGTLLLSNTVGQPSRLWDVNKRQIIHLTKSSYYPRTIIFSADGSQLISTDNGFRFEDFNTQQNEYYPECGIIGAISASVDGLRLAAITEPEQIAIWNIKTKEVEILLGISSDEAFLPNFNDKGNLLGCAFGWGPRLGFWSIPDFTQAGELFPELDRILDFKFSPDGKLLACLSEDHFYQQTLLELWTIKHI